MEVGLVILDGWGLNPDDDARDAVSAADTPHFDRYWAAGATGTLITHGKSVGLPPGQMGNSEVGHLTIGAGRVVLQESARISDAVARWREEDSEFDDPVDPPLDDNDTLTEVFDNVEANESTLHLLSLISDGGVHSYQSHVHALIELAAEYEIPTVTHAFTDGRDTSPHGGRSYLEDLESFADEVGTGDVATVIGRYYAMDRDENWDRTYQTYDAIVNRNADYAAESALEGITAAYDRDSTDEFVEPTCIDGTPALADGDGAIFVNFRADRARQLTRMLANIEPDWSMRTDPPDIHFVTMTEYDDTFHLPVAFPPRRPRQTLGEVLAETDHTQLRIAETEKYAHVTYFLNGGREEEFAGERRHIEPSPDVPTYDRQPAMSAPAVTDAAIDIVDQHDPDVVVLNYANPDMVGHTGDFEAAVKAVEAVDQQLGRLVERFRANGATSIITADHGNADNMGTKEDPHTAHTTNPVPLICLEAGESTEYTCRSSGTLADITPTILEVLTLHQPEVMTGDSLIIT